MKRLGIRRRLLLTVVAGIALALVAVVAAFNIFLARTLDGDARSVVRSRAISLLATVQTDGGRITLGEAPDAGLPDGGAWVFAGRRALERPRAAPAVQRAAVSLAAGPARFVDLAAPHVRLYGAPVVADGRRIGTVVAAISLEPYDGTRRAALIASLILGGLVMIVVSLAAYWLLGAALRPVARMTRQAAAWSERDLDRRFAVGQPYDELSELAVTLDGLLDGLAASLRREQRFSAEVSHELRTPLARVMAESELALQRDRTPEGYRRALEQITRSAADLTRIVDALVAAARHEAGLERGSADAYAVAADAVAACSGLAAERRLSLDLAEPSVAIRIGVEPEVAQRILQPLLENACRYGSTLVRVSIERAGGVVHFTVDDDGPGVAAEERETIFEPGVRGEAGSRDGSGAGLGLALSRRLARGASGDVEALPRSEGGRFVITLPVTAAKR